MIRIAFVEDDFDAFAALSAALHRQPTLRLVGQWPSAEDALADAAWEGIDVLLVDLELPGKSGVELIRHLAHANPGVRTIVHTVHDGRPALFAALHAGATGYVLKGSTGAELATAAADAIAGRSPMSPIVARHLVEVFRAEISAEAPQPLTDREAEILALLARGSSYTGVAEKLAISAHTVHAHVRKIYAKLHASSREQAVRHARMAGFLPPPGPKAG
jgi:two-component system NarL family response regulator